MLSGVACADRCEQLFLMSQSLMLALASPPDTKRLEYAVEIKDKAVIETSFLFKWLRELLVAMFPLR